MKRKVNLVGTNTLTISLPTQWAKTHGIKKGDELDVVDDGPILNIGSKHKPQFLEVKLDLSGTGVMLNRAIVAIYKAGYDRALVSYESPEELNLIQETVYRSCHTYEIMGIRKNMVEIKAISGLDPYLFEQVLRKMAHSIITIAKELHEAAKNEDYEELSNIILQNWVMDRHTDYCRRIINKGYQLNYKRISPLYLIAEQTEIAADILKRICHILIDKKTVLGKEILDFHSKLIALMEDMYNAVFDFKIETIKNIGLKETKIRNEIIQLCDKEKNNTMVLSYFICFFEIIFEMKSAVLTLHL